jgi:hypothetical protein
MSSRRIFLFGGVSLITALSGCSGISINETQLQRSLGFVRKERFHRDQPSLSAGKPSISSYLIKNDSEASAIENWEILLKRTYGPYQDTDYSSDFLVIHVGVVYSGQQIEVGQPKIGNNTMSYSASVSGDPNDSNEPTFSYRLEKWSKGILFDPDSVTSSFER